MTGCSTLPSRDERTPRVQTQRIRGVDYQPLPAAAGSAAPEAQTVEDHWLLHTYSALHGDHYRNFRVVLPAQDGSESVAHFSVPEGMGPHPTVLVFPILAGSHLVSEMLGKVLVDRGYAVLRLERTELFPEPEREADFPPIATRLADSIREGRRALDWVLRQPEVDPERIGVAGVSLGGIMAATLLGVDPRVDAGFFIMAGGGIAEILFDSREKPVRSFRDRVMAQRGLANREQFIAAATPHTQGLDPLTYAGQVETNRVRLISARFDRIVPPERTRDLWSAFGEPTWHRVPTGHYSLIPFFWWSANRGADHLDARWSP